MTAATAMSILEGVLSVLGWFLIGLVLVGMLLGLVLLVGVSRHLSRDARARDREQVRR